MSWFRLSLLAAAPMVVSAVTVSYIDPFGAAASSCNTTNCDVTGDPLFFDLDQMTLTVDPAALTGLAIGALTAGNLYEAGSPGGLLTASEVFGSPPGRSYRPDSLDWLNDDGHSSVRSVGSGSVLTAVTGDGVTAQFTPAADLVTALLGSGVTTRFATATYGNDILSLGFQAAPDHAPEPAPLVLVGVGLAALALRRYGGLNRSNRAARGQSG